MYGVTFDNSNKSTLKTRHGYEQFFEDIQVLPEQNNFLLIFPMHLWSRLTGEQVGPYIVFQILGFENIRCCSGMGFLMGPTRLRN